jgi:hypothetical protein
MTKESAKSRNSAMVKPSPAGVLGEMQVGLCRFSKIYVKYSKQKIIIIIFI